MMHNYKFNDVALLVTHYNRSTSLQRLLEAFRSLKCEFEEVVVSDDGSSKEHLSLLLSLKEEFGFKLILSDINRGLGNNINKGQEAVTAEMTLYVQEDFVPTQLFPEKFLNAVQLFHDRPDLDLIRFYAYYSYPYLVPYKYGFSEMQYKVWYSDYRKIYFYSDHPHLRRSSFLKKFGKYAEGIKGDRTEYRKCIDVLQNRAKGLFFDDYTKMFDQVNTDLEPSTMTRSNWTQTNNPLISILRGIYRQIKYNYDLLFFRSR